MIDTSIRLAERLPGDAFRVLSGLHPNGKENPHTQSRFSPIPIPDRIRYLLGGLKH